MTSQLLKKERRLRIVPTLGPTTDMVQLGRRLRQLRTSRGIGVRTLARMINVSPSLISHIELGKGAPSVKTLYALVAAFDVPLSEIFAESSGALRPSRANRIAKPATADHIKKPDTEHGSNRFIQRGDTRRAIHLEHGFRWECLTPGTDPEVEFMETVIAVGGGRPDSEMKTHNGTEYGIVLSGRLGIKIAFETFILGPRDSIRFESNLPHCMWNAGDEPVHSIWFVRGRSPG